MNIFSVKYRFFFKNRYEYPHLIRFPNSSETLGTMLDKRLAMKLPFKFYLLSVFRKGFSGLFDQKNSMRGHHTQYNTITDQPGL